MLLNCGPTFMDGAVTEDLNDIPAGNYSVSVTDFMGCEVLDQFELIRPSDLETNCATLFFPNLLPPLKFIMEPSEC